MAVTRSVTNVAVRMVVRMAAFIFDLIFFIVENSFIVYLIVTIPLRCRGHVVRDHFN